MEPMMKIINALSALTAALQEYTAKTTDGYMSTFEEIYDPQKDKPNNDAPQAPVPAEKTVTLEDVRTIHTRKSREGFTEDIKALITKFGAEKLSDVKKEDYAAILAEAEVIGSAG